mmetsp:Transcript_10727/g.25578  ORF Transcript_10727/g.25578 Transcript_10727/m.25578 type:complete len:350 (+) Transcript_10727:507-1556(+)
MVLRAGTVSVSAAPARAHRLGARGVPVLVPLRSLLWGGGVLDDPQGHAACRPCRGSPHLRRWDVAEHWLACAHWLSGVMAPARPQWSIGVHSLNLLQAQASSQGADLSGALVQELGLSAEQGPRPGQPQPANGCLRRELVLRDAVRGHHRSRSSQPSSAVDSHGARRPLGQVEKCPDEVHRGAGHIRKLHVPDTNTTIVKLFLGVPRLVEAQDEVHLLAPGLLAVFIHRGRLVAGQVQEILVRTQHLSIVNPPRRVGARHELVGHNPTPVHPLLQVPPAVDVDVEGYPAETQSMLEAPQDRQRRGAPRASHSPHEGRARIAAEWLPSLFRRSLEDHHRVRSDQGGVQTK